MNPCPLQYERLTHYPSTSHGHTVCVWPKGQPPSSQISAAGSHHERSSTQEGRCELWGEASAITYPTTFIFHVKGWEQLVKSRASSSVSPGKIPQVLCKCPGAAGPCLGAGCGGCTQVCCFTRGSVCPHLSSGKCACVCPFAEIPTQTIYALLTTLQRPNSQNTQGNLIDSSNWRRELRLMKLYGLLNKRSLPK